MKYLAMLALALSGCSQAKPVRFLFNEPVIIASTATIYFDCDGVVGDYEGVSGEYRYRVRLSRCPHAPEVTGYVWFKEKDLFKGVLK